MTVRDKETLAAIHRTASDRRDEYFQSHSTEVCFERGWFVARAGFPDEGLTATGRTPHGAVLALWDWLLHQNILDVSNELRDADGR